MKYVSDEDIYDFYIGSKISFRKAFFSPFREETQPSMTFIRMSDGAVLWRDWGDSDQMKPESAVKFVMRVYNCSFIEAINHIKDDIGNGNNISLSFVKRPFNPSREKKKREIHIKSRYFDDNDIAYWSQYGISLDTLSKYNVIPISEWFYNNYPMDKYDGIHPLYAYKLIGDGNVYYKIYNPLTKDYKRKWRYNGTDKILLGYDQLPANGSLIILTKSLKDVMVLNEMGYSAVSLQSETLELDTMIYSSLKKRFDNIVILYDNDTTGIKRSNTLSKSFGIPTISLPVSSGKKDISDYVSRYGFLEGKKIMNILLTNINEKV